MHACPPFLLPSSPPLHPPTHSTRPSHLEAHPALGAARCRACQLQVCDLAHVGGGELPEHHHLVQAVEQLGAEVGLGGGRGGREGGEERRGWVGRRGCARVRKTELPLSIHRPPNPSHHPLPTLSSSSTSERTRAYLVAPSSSPPGSAKPMPPPPLAMTALPTLEVRMMRACLKETTRPWESACGGAGGGGGGWGGGCVGCEGWR